MAHFSDKQFIYIIYFLKRILKRRESLLFAEIFIKSSPLQYYHDDLAYFTISLPICNANIDAISSPPQMRRFYSPFNFYAVTPVSHHHWDCVVELLILQYSWETLSHRYMTESVPLKLSTNEMSWLSTYWSYEFIIYDVTGVPFETRLTNHPKKLWYRCNRSVTSRASDLLGIMCTTTLWLREVCI